MGSAQQGSQGELAGRLEGGGVQRGGGSVGVGEGGGCHALVLEEAAGAAVEAAEAVFGARAARALVECGSFSAYLLC